MMEITGRTALLADAVSRGGPRDRCAVHFGKPMLEAQIDLMIEFTGLTTKEER